MNINLSLYDETEDIPFTLLTNVFHQTEFIKIRKNNFWIEKIFAVKVFNFLGILGTHTFHLLTAIGQIRSRHELIVKPILWVNEHNSWVLQNSKDRELPSIAYSSLNESELL